MENNLNTAQIIGLYFVKNRTRKAALARRLHKNISHIMGLQKKPSIQTQTLWELCHALEHNFFLDIAAQLPIDYSTNAPANHDKDQIIALLQQQILKLQTEKDVLLQAFGK